MKCGDQQKALYVVIWSFVKSQAYYQVACQAEQTFLGDLCCPPSMGREDWYELSENAAGPEPDQFLTVRKLYQCCYGWQRAQTLSLLLKTAWWNITSYPFDDIIFNIYIAQIIIRQPIFNIILYSANWHTGGYDQMWFNPFIHTRLRRRLGTLNHLSALVGQNRSTVRRITLLIWPGLSSKIRLFLNGTPALYSGDGFGKNFKKRLIFPFQCYRSGQYVLTSGKRFKTALSKH